jgi:hypothetical protein
MVQNSQQNQKPVHTEYPHRISTLFRSHPSKCYTKREWFVLSSVFGIRSVGEISPYRSLTLKKANRRRKLARTPDNIRYSAANLIGSRKLIEPPLEKLIGIIQYCFNRFASTLYANHATRNTMRGGAGCHGSEALNLARRKDFFPKDDAVPNLRFFDREAGTSDHGHHKDAPE